MNGKVSVSGLGFLAHIFLNTRQGWESAICFYQLFQFKWNAQDFCWSNGILTLQNTFSILSKQKDPNCSSNAAKSFELQKVFIPFTDFYGNLIAQSFLSYLFLAITTLCLLPLKQYSFSNESICYGSLAVEQLALVTCGGLYQTSWPTLSGVFRFATRVHLQSPSGHHFDNHPKLYGYFLIQAEVHFSEQVFTWKVLEHRVLRGTVSPFCSNLDWD